ncbi:endo alpha-1,4 polygalactosaminidase [Flavobacterium columnare]|nr:endo alpha-1,4 polygalactosaminidase [Flavobacterium columnare]ANO47564.1 putative glucanotransferase [Flavobacterium columnare]QOG60823.1 endo alpha-1,4 polygalactosaminidase [Flavobacterium columnare]QOG88039.1 endo alpha-1,4 polygalactosaminidase [Flavobacterium columnare]QOG89320.1 endo alpha-1,4 polygalactosaminidase [Flavobacterium columnare]QOG94644.1 endo alpha-1,4 polygalactosaminidase [Flavobacterium columnare]
MLFLCFSFNSHSKTKFLVCYGKFDITKVSGYDLLIVESAHFTYNEVSYLRRNNKKVIAYISLGEINEGAKDYKLLKSAVSEKNTDWNSYYLDIGSSKIQKVLKSRIQNIFYMGYDGLFLDNIDNYTEHGVQYNLQNNLVAFIGDIRREYPNKVLVQNAGLDLVKVLHNQIDYVLVESVYTDYDFQEKRYLIRNSESFSERLGNLKKAINKYKIKPLLLEYAVDESQIKKIRKRIKSENITYSISEISLQKIKD